MATVVYGGCIEPGGMELEEEHGTALCPKCAAQARTWFIESAEGGTINVYMGLACNACGHEEGDSPD